MQRVGERERRRKNSVNSGHLVPCSECTPLRQNSSYISWYIKGSFGIGDWSGLRGNDVLQVMCHDIGVGVMYHVMGHG